MSINKSGFGLVLLIAAGLSMGMLFSSCADRQKAIEQAQLHYKMAIDLDVKGENTQALAAALRAEKYNSRDPEVQHLLGIMFIRNKMYDRAEQHLKKALDLNKEYSEASTALSYLYIEKNMFDEAIEQGLKAVENITYDTPERAYNNVGWAYYKKGDINQATNYFRKALLHNKDFFLPHMHLANIYYENGKYSDAKKEYQASIKGCGECANLYYQLGLTLLKLKDKAEAVKTFEQCKNTSKQDEDFAEKCSKKLAILR